MAVAVQQNACGSTAQRQRGLRDVPIGLEEILEKDGPISNHLRTPPGFASQERRNVFTNC